MSKAKQQRDKGKQKVGCSSKTARKNTLNKLKSTEKSLYEHIVEAIPIAPILILQKGDLCQLIF